MGKEEIFNYLRNAKIENNTLREICYCFSEDLTAIETAKRLNLSRQTINNYYKILRNILLQNQDELISFMKENNLCKNSFAIKYIKSKDYISYFIHCDDKIFLIDEQNPCLPNFDLFLKEHLDTSLINNRIANCAKVLFNEKNKKYLVTKLYKTTNEIQDFISTRLKKFRGLNKQTLGLHLKESQFRYNYSNKYLHETLLNSLNLNYKTST